MKVLYFKPVRLGEFECPECPKCDQCHRTHNKGQLFRAVNVENMAKNVKISVVIKCRKHIAPQHKIMVPSAKG